MPRTCCCGRKICHWDIRPSGILINGNGNVKILDLGLGLQEGQQTSLNTMVVGNPAYMSPERCEGESGDHRADIYGLGCLLHYLLRGVPPYQHSNPVALLKAQRSEPLPSLQEYGFPANLDALLAGMMAKIRRRFASYDELIEEIKPANH